MTTPKRGLLFHFTHISNLTSIAEHGLWCDTRVMKLELLETEVGQPEIKEKRRLREVPIQPGGVVADYVPFYFAARSPMLGSIHKGRNPAYTDGQDEVVYLVTDIKSLVNAGVDFVFTDRNAVMPIAMYDNDVAHLGDLVDWPLMEGLWWNNTQAEPDRMERRMAEFLVYQHVPWSAFIGVYAINENQCRRVEAELTRLSMISVVQPRPNWYF